MIETYLTSGDRLGFLQNLRTFDLRCLVTDLRRWPFTNATERAVALELAATFALREHSHNKHVVATACGALLDCNQVTSVVEALRTHHEFVTTSSHILNVFARTLNMRGRRNSCAEAFRLAEQVKGGQVLSARQLQWLHARLGDGFLGAPDPHEPWPQGQEALERPQRLEGVLPVPTLPGVTVRQLESRNQIERFANHLRNCLSNMRVAIEADATRVIGIERDGTPVEAVEVNPRGGRIRQWKATSNAEPNSATRPVIERFLLDLGVIRRRRPGAPG